MPAAVLQQLQTVTIAGGGVLVLAHNLTDGAGNRYVPNIVMPERSTELVVTTADATTVTYSNPSADPLTAIFLVQFDHTIQQATPPAGNPPFQYWWQGATSAIVPGTLTSNCFVYQPTAEGPGTAGPVVFSDWATLYAALDAARTIANDDGCWSIEFDDSQLGVVPIVVPVAGMPVAGWDMTSVEWVGRTPAQVVGGGLGAPGAISPVAVTLTDGVLLPGLRVFRGLIQVEALSGGISPISDFVHQDVVYISDGAIITSAGAGVAPFFDAAGLAAGEGIGVNLWNGGALGGRDPLVQIPNLVNTYVTLRLGVDASVGEGTLTVGANALLFLVLDSPAVFVGPQAGVAGVTARTNPNLTYRTAQTPRVILVDGANVAIDVELGDSFRLTAGALGTRQLDNPTGADPDFTRTIVIEFIHGGVEALTFGADYNFGDPGAPAYPAAGTRDMFTMIWNGATWDVSYVQGLA